MDYCEQLLLAFLCGVLYGCVCLLWFSRVEIIFKRMEPRVAFSEVIQTVNTIGNHIQWWDDCRKDLNYLISGGRWWLHRDWKSEEVPTIQLASSSKRSADVQELLDNPGARGGRAGRASCASTPGLLLMLKTHRGRWLGEGQRMKLATTFHFL